MQFQDLLIRGGTGGGLDKGDDFFVAFYLATDHSGDSDIGMFGKGGFDLDGNTLKPEQMISSLLRPLICSRP